MKLNLLYIEFSFDGYTVLFTPNPKGSVRTYAAKVITKDWVYGFQTDLFANKSNAANLIDLAIKERTNPSVIIRTLPNEN